MAKKRPNPSALAAKRKQQRQRDGSVVSADEQQWEDNKQFIYETAVNVLTLVGLLSDKDTVRPMIRATSTYIIEQNESADVQRFLDEMSLDSPKEMTQLMVQQCREVYGKQATLLSMPYTTLSKFDEEGRSSADYQMENDPLPPEKFTIMRFEMEDYFGVVRSAMQAQYAFAIAKASLDEGDGLDQPIRSSTAKELLKKNETSGVVSPRDMLKLALEDMKGLTEIQYLDTLSEVASFMDGAEEPFDKVTDTINAVSELIKIIEKQLEKAVTMEAGKKPQKSIKLR